MPSYETIERGLYLILRDFTPEELERWCQRMGFTAAQHDYLRWVAGETRGFTVDQLESFMFDHRHGMASVFPGYVHAKDHELLLKAGDPRKLHEYLRGKNVVLVGPAATLTGKGEGEAIDSFDVIVRMNQQWPIADADRTDLGSRIHILYHCCNGDFPVESIFTAGTGEMRFICYELGAACFKMIDLARACGIDTLNVSMTYYDAEARLGAYPSTGIAAILHLLAAPISRLHLTGLTMFQTPYRAGYAATGNVPNSWEGGRAPELVGPHRTSRRRRRRPRARPPRGISRTP